MKVTVFTSCYNQGNYIKQSIESVLCQTYTEFEYLIFDDGSNDDTWDIISNYASRDKRIIATKLDKQKNVACVINKSFDMMTGDAWIWCPSDDILDSTLIEKKVLFNVTNPHAVIYNDFSLIDENGKYISTVNIKYYTPEYFKDLVFKESPLGFTGIFIPKRIINKVGKFPEHIDYSEDYYWMVKATIDDVIFLGISEILHMKRIHDNRLTFQNNKNIPQMVIKIRKELTEYKNKKYENELQYPKRIYFFWGSLEQKISWMRYMSIKSFKILNPDWEIILCYSNSTTNNKVWKGFEKQDFFEYKSDFTYLNELKELEIEFRYWDVPYEILDISPLDLSPSHKSNLFKYYILWKNGGIYSDMDIIYYKPISKFYDQIKSYDTIICAKKDYLSIGFLGASKKENNFWKDIFFNSFVNYDTSLYQTFGVDNIYRLYGTINGIKVFNDAIKKYSDLKFYNILFEIIYPYNCSTIQIALENNISIADLNNATICFHWYAGHESAQKLNNILNHENFKNYKNLFTSIAQIFY